MPPLLALLVKYWNCEGTEEKVATLHAAIASLSCGHTPCNVTMVEHTVA